MRVINGRARRAEFAAICLLLACLLCATFAGTALAASNPIEVTIPVEQIVENMSAGAKDSFSYELLAVAKTNPLPLGSASGRYTFALEGNAKLDLKLTFTQAGVYEYTARQLVPEDEKGFLYDKEEYTVKVYIKNAAEAGLFESEVIVQRKDLNKTAALIFKNVRDTLSTDPKLMTDPPVRKVIKGTPPAAATFEFKLTSEKAEYPMPEGAKDGVKTIKITGAGTGEFGTWTYTAAGTYKYTVSELNNGISGYTYDTLIYTITDVVSEKDGALTLTRSVTDKDGKSTKECVFTNSYKTSDGPKTGDDANATLLTVVLIVCAAIAVGAAVYLVILMKRRKRDEAER